MAPQNANIAQGGLRRLSIVTPRPSELAERYREVVANVHLALADVTLRGPEQVLTRWQRYFDAATPPLDRLVLLRWRGYSWQQRTRSAGALESRRRAEA